MTPVSTLRIARTLDGWNRRDTLLAAAVAAVALTLHALYLASLHRTLYFDHLIINAAQYDRWAREGYPASEPFYQAPLYIYFLKAIYAVSSEPTRLLLVRFVHALLGAGTAVLAYVAARRWWGTFSGTAAGFLCACTGSLLYFDGEVLPNALETFLFTAGIVLFLQAREDALDERGSTQARGKGWGLLHRPGAWRWLFTGLVFGAACACRPTFLLPVGLVLCDLSWQHLRHRRSVSPPTGRWSTLAAPLAFALGIVVPVAAISLRNQQAGQGFVLLTTNWGDNLLLAHNPEADGLNPIPPPALERSMRALDRQEPNEVLRSRAKARAAWAYVKDDPRRTLSLWWKKLWLFYNRTEIPNNRSIREQVSLSPILRWPPAGWIGAGLLFPLALAGWVVVRKRSLLARPLLLVVIGAPLSFAPFLVCARFRAPFLPVLAVLAAALVGVRPRRWRALLAPAAAALVGASIAWPNWYGVRDTEFLPLYTNRAKLYREAAIEARARGDSARAQELTHQVRSVLEEAVRRYPAAALPRSRLADVLREEGDLQRAHSLYEQALAADLLDARAHLGLALIARGHGRFGEAVAHLQRALSIEPEEPGFHSELGRTWYAAGREAEGVEAYRRMLAFGSAVSPRDAQHARAQIHLGQARIAERQRDIAQAESELRAAIDSEPGNARYWVELGHLLHRNGRTAECVRILQESLARGGLPAPQQQAVRDFIRTLQAGR